MSFSPITAGMKGMEAVVEINSTPGISVFPVPIQCKIWSRKADRHCIVRWEVVAELK